MAVGLVGLLTSRVPTQDQEIVGRGERPLHAAIKQIEKRFDLIIAYEDSPYLAPSESLDVTSSRRPGASQPILIPRGGDFYFHSPTDARGLGPQRALLATLVAEFNRSQTNAVFVGTWDDGVFNVRPTQALNKSGQMHVYRSALDAVVTLPGGPRSCAAAIMQILEAANATQPARRLLYATPSPNPLDRIKFEGPIDHVSARTAIARVIAASGARLSWQVMCVPGEGQGCYFSTTPPGMW